MAQLLPIVSGRTLSRLGLAAASILAAGLAVWSGSERLVTRAAIHPTDRSTIVQARSVPRREVPVVEADPISPERTDHPPDQCNTGRPSRTEPARPGDPAPAGLSASRRPVAPTVALATTIRPWRALADSARSFAAAGMATIAGWMPSHREAAAAARAWLDGFSLTSARAPDPRSIARVEPQRDAPLSQPTPALRLGLPESLEIEAGRSLSIPIRVDRDGHSESLSVHFEGLPTGVTIPDLTIPSGQDRGGVVARARLDAPAATTPVAMSIRSSSSRADARLRVRVRPNPAMLSRTRGHTLLACGRHAEAVAAFTAAIRAGVKDAPVFNHRGVAYATLNQFEPAIQDYSEAIRLSPTDAAYRYNRGLAFARRGDDVRALLDLDTAIRLRPTDIRAFEARARIYKKHGDMLRSCADSGRASELARAARAEGQPPAPQPPQSAAPDGPARSVPGAHPATASH